MNVSTEDNVADLCCGSGSVGLELIKIGCSVTMVDIGMWGKFWNLISTGEFDISEFMYYYNRLPSRELEHSYLLELSKETPGVYSWIFLQAGSYGSKEVFVRDGMFVHHGFRLFKKYSDKQFFTIYPKPETMVDRIKSLIPLAGTFTALQADLFSMDLSLFDKIYIDPPYVSTTGYSNNFRIQTIFNATGGVDLFISEGYPMDGATEIYYLKDRAKAKLYANNNTVRTEILSCFRGR